MAQRRSKSESLERAIHQQHGLVLAGIQAAELARKRMAHPESVKPSPTSAPEKTADKPSTKGPIPAPRSRSKTLSGPITLKPTASFDSAGSSSLSSASSQRTVASKGTPPPVAKKPRRLLKQLPSVGVDSRRMTLPQNWKLVGCQATDKREEECLHPGGKRIIYTVLKHWYNLRLDYTSALHKRIMLCQLKSAHETEFENASQPCKQKARVLASMYKLSRILP